MSGGGFSPILILMLAVAVAFGYNNYAGYKRRSGFLKGGTSDLDVAKFNKFFMEPIEKFVSSLGNNYIQNFLTDGSLSNGFAVVSDKRVYFKGKAYSKEGKRIYKTNEERVVDLKDVTGTGYIMVSKTSSLIRCAISGALGVISIYAMSQKDKPSTDPGILEVSILVFISFAIYYLLDYFMRRLNLFEISFAGGKICFDTVWYGKDEIDDFQRQLRIAKDTVLAKSSTMQASNVAFETKRDDSLESNADVADQIRKYSDLLKEGLITQGEYDKVKVNLLG